MFVIGDTEGHDKLCGKYLNRSENVSCLCRYCNIPTDQTDNPFALFELTKASKIAELVERDATQELQQLSYHKLKNCFIDMKFCDNELGINGATIAEILHFVHQG